MIECAEDSSGLVLHEPFNTTPRETQSTTVMKSGISLKQNTTVLKILGLTVVKEFRENMASIPHNLREILISLDQFGSI